MVIILYHDSLRKKVFLKNLMGTISKSVSKDVSEAFLTSIGNLQNYTISTLLEDCYLCTSLGKVISKTCWIIQLLYLLFFNADMEVEQQSRAIIREKATPFMHRRTIRKSSKSVLYYNNSSATRRLILSGDIETNPGPVSHVITSKPNQNLATYDRLPVTYATRQYE